MFCDFVALVLQGAGGGLVAGSDPLDQATFDTGLSILRAGLAFHVAGMLAFVLLASSFAGSVWKHRTTTAKEVDNDFLGLRKTRRFRGFVLSMALTFSTNRFPNFLHEIFSLTYFNQLALSISTLCIFIRTCYRLAELSMGLDSDLANDEVAFLVLEGAMVAIAVIALSIFHPGVAFQGLWGKADFQLVSMRPQGVESQEVISNGVELQSDNIRDSH